MNSAANDHETFLSEEGEPLGVAVTQPLGGPAKALSVILFIAQMCLFAALAFLVILMGMSLFGAVDTAEMAKKSVSAGGHMTLVGYGLASVVVMIAIVHQLRKLVRTLVNGDPFVPQNARRLRYIWIILAGAEIVRTIAEPILSKIGNAGASGFDLDVRLHVWFFILILIVLAQVFREGARLRAEAQLTV